MLPALKEIHLNTYFFVQSMCSPNTYLPVFLLIFLLPFLPLLRVKYTNYIRKTITKEVKEPTHPTEIPFIKYNPKVMEGLKRHYTIL